VNGPVLAVPCIEKAKGRGHLVRCAALVLALREKGREAFLYVPPEKQEETYRRLETLCAGLERGWIYPSRPAENSPAGDAFAWDFIVTDRFRTPLPELARWRALAPVIGIDEGGPWRDKFDFLIDLLPGFRRRVNLAAIKLLPLPRNRRRSFFGEPRGREAVSPKPFRVLISFGADDPAGLALPAARSLAAAAGEAGAEITLAAPGPDRETTAFPAGVKAAGNIPGLRERLAEYDLLVTHFGLTAFEALYARLPVLIVSPTPYHEKLAARAGFASLGRGPGAAAKLGRALFPRQREAGALYPDAGFTGNISRLCGEIAARFGLDTPQSQTLGDDRTAAEPFVSTACPVCGAFSDKNPVAGRFPERSYRRCRACGLVFMDRMNAPPVEYAEDYFFSLYKKQYGKTYLEDFPGLRETGRRRLARIKALLKTAEKGERGLLDIGCAYGPFAAAARDEGFSPMGIEPAEDAARYVREELGIPCIHGFFPQPLERRFGVVTLWYVIEHFRRPDAVLGEINRLLMPGGVLAFSTPSFSGVSGRKSLSAFLKNSPADHWTVWSPRYCKKLLGKYGFSVKKIVVTGHHPERFPFARIFFRKNRGFFFNFGLVLSRIFALGDTFEVYAVKKNTEI
jgi:2-polyprenyl-3-methyl-5-hydroxy-6-metoxy-1,4-benzoquinol methylase